MTTKPVAYAQLGHEIGQMTEAKAQQYGNAADKVERIMRELYPQGVPPHAFRNALLIVRMLDKVCRIANQGPDGKDKGGESPFADLAGYSLIGLKRANEGGF